MRQCADEGGRYGFEAGHPHAEVKPARQVGGCGKRRHARGTEQVGDFAASGNPSRFQDEPLVERFEGEFPVMSHRQHCRSSRAPSEYSFPHHRA